MKAAEAREKLHALASHEVAATSARFFKTGPGQYGEGDTFIGVRVPALRNLARECRILPLTETEALLHAPVHEERLFALLVLVLGVGKCATDPGVARGLRCPAVKCVRRQSRSELPTHR